MSMMGKFREIPAGLAARLMSDPSRVEDIVRGGFGKPSGASESPSRWAESMEALAKELPLKEAAEVKQMVAHCLKDLDTHPAELRMPILEHFKGIVLKTVKKHRKRSPAPRAVSDSEPGELLDLEKAWHGVHFLLAGDAQKTSPGAGQAVLGGAAVGPELGYGKARLMEPKEVATVSTALSQLTIATLKKQFKPSAFDQAEIYPGGWVEAGEGAEWLLEAFEQLRKFYAAAASRGSAILLYIT
jgi:hypothetical protein